MLSRLKVLLTALAVAGLSLAPAHAQDVVKTGHAEASLIAEHSAVAPGDTVLLALKLDLEDHWHVYWKNAGDSGLPPQVTWSSAPGTTTGFKYPAPEAIRFGPLMNYGYEHQLILPMEFTIPKDVKVGDKLVYSGKFEWLICSDVCVPEDATLSLTLPVKKTPEASQSGARDIISVLPTVPVKLTGQAAIERTEKGFRVGATDPDLAKAAATAKDIRFFPNGQEIAHPAPQKIRTGAAGVSIELFASELAKPGNQPLPGIIVTVQPDGVKRAWDVDPQPGALPPAIADKEFVSAIVDAAPPPPVASPKPVVAETPPMGLTDLLAVLGFAFLGGMVLNLMPCVLPVLTIKAAGLVHTAHDPKQSRAHGLAYLGGVLVCFAVIGAILIALKAAGDASAGLGFQLQYSWVTAFFALVMFAVGLNLLGVFEIGSSLMGLGGGLADRGGASGAFFTGLLAAFVGAPCVGPFMAPAVGVALSQPAPIVMATFLMIGLGMAMPFVALSFTPAVAKILPKPGAWMATFRQVLAFPMFLTVLWLLWVVAGQSGSDGVIMVVGGAVALAFGIWLATKIGGGLLGRVLAGAVILLAFIGAPLATTWARNQDPSGAATATNTVWSASKVADLRKQNRVIFIDFTARWCVTCQVNLGAINDAATQKAFKDHSVAFLVADWTNKNEEIAAELASHGRAGVPLYLVYPASGGDPVILDQLLSPGMIVKAVNDAAASL